MTVPSAPGPASSPLRLPEASRTAALLQSMDWSASPLGPPERWPDRLRTAVGIAVGGRMPMVVLWGEDYVQIYNDAYADILGSKHPASLGRPARECWAELWDTIGPMFDSVLRTGKGIWAENLRLDMLRDGHLEECYFTISWSPILGEGTRVEGIFASAVETTQSVLAARRLGVLRALAQEPCGALSAEQCLLRCAAELAAHPGDFPFAAVYLCAPGGDEAWWVAGHGEPGQAHAPRTLDLRGDSLLAAAVHARSPQPLRWPPAPAQDAAQAAALPLRRPGRPEPVGLLLVGLHTLRPLDGAHQYFLGQVAEQLGAALGRVDAFERAHQERVEVLERMTDGFYALDRRGRVTYVNAAAERLLQRTREQLLGHELRQLFPGVRGSRFELEYRRAMRDQVPVQFRAPSLVTEGWREVHAYPSPQGLSVFFQDVTERRHAEQQLQESEERYRSVFELNPLPMWLYDPDSLAFLEVNAAAVERYGYSREEFLRMKLQDIRPPEEVPRLRAGLEHTEQGRRNAGLFVHRRKDGQLLQVEMTVDRLVIGGRTVHLALAHDVTERKLLEAQLRQSQKMEAVGQLAGGIAHDFNNLLAVIGTYTRLVLEDVPAGTQQREDLEEVRGAVDRAVGLTRQLLAFSRQQTLLLEPLELNQVVRDAERMLRRVIREDIHLVTQLTPELPPVHADRGQLEQVLLNLVVNARDAMPDGGTLTLQTASHTLTEEGVEGRPGLKPGSYVRLVVRDTGHGMDERTRQRIFEPFFTTKPVGKGTGLGLSMVYGVLQQLGGHIEVESAPGQGTTFTLLLPLSSEVEEEVRSPELHGEGSLRGSETVLVVEDDAAVRRSARRLLERQGYTVLEASEGREALSLLEQHAHRIQLVLADLVMPVLGGQELARSVRERWPRVRTLIMSGHDPGAARGAEGFVLKPFTAGGLLRQLREALQPR